MLHMLSTAGFVRYQGGFELSIKCFVNFCDHKYNFSVSLYFGLSRGKLIDSR